MAFDYIIIHKRTYYQSCASLACLVTDSRTFYCLLHRLPSTIPPSQTDGTQQWLSEEFQKTHSPTKQFCQFSNLPLALLLCWFEQNTCLMERTACQYPYLCYIFLVSWSLWFLNGCNCCGWSGECRKGHLQQIDLIMPLQGKNDVGPGNPQCQWHFDEDLRRIMDTFGRLCCEYRQSLNFPAKWLLIFRRTSHGGERRAGRHVSKCLPTRVKKSSEVSDSTWKHIVVKSSHVKSAC